MNNPLLTLESTVLYYATTWMANPHHITISRGITAVIGPNGAGKSLLGEIIAHGRNFRTNHIITPDGFKVKKVEFAYIHSLRGITARGYYQQRYEATMNDDVPMVAELLSSTSYIDEISSMCIRLGLEGIMEKRINYLSSGELRKLLIAVTLAEHPDLLILDNPYIGLDTTSRTIITEAISRMAADGINIMLLLCDPYDMPDNVNTVIPVSDMTIGETIHCHGNMQDIRETLLHMFMADIDMSAIPPRPCNLSAPYDVIVKFNNCTISNGSRQLVESLNWTIKDNENWSLSGPNGSGKSTILSLINADNPAVYRSDITLFDRRRGSGESIWDIKRMIGYVSPEMRLYFTGSGDLESIIGHGLVDTVGNYVRLSDSQKAHAQAWIKLLGMDGLQAKAYNTLSAGQRQLALVARALIKQPRLLILDEPMHGLDYGRKKAMRHLLEHMSLRAWNTPDTNPMSMIYVTHHADELPSTITNTLSL